MRADNYDVRIHMSGTNCSGCGSTNTFAGTTALTGAVSGTVIQNGDLLTWRQYQDGVASGGISVAFNNNTVGTSGVLVAADGQLADKDTRGNNWYLREADLSAYSGMTVSSLNFYNYQGGAAGNWDIFLGDISLVHANGTVVPIYHRTMTSLSQFPPGAAESNVSVITDKWFNEPTTLVYPTYYSGDQIGSTRVVTSGGGWPMSSETYYLFGQEQSPTTDPNHYKFTSLERDSESGLDHAIFRQYSSSAGRWMSPDPSLGSINLANPQSLNRYSYVGNSPLTSIDPSGLASAPPNFTNFNFSNYFVNVCGGSQDMYMTWAPCGLSTDGASVYDIRGIAQAQGSADPRIGAFGMFHPDPYSSLGDMIGGVLGLPSGGCEFGVCGGGFTQDGQWAGQAGRGRLQYGAASLFELLGFSVAYADLNDPNKRLYGTHYCGPGGGGSETGQVDHFCHLHDICYANAGITAGIQLGGGTDAQLNAMGSCNQHLCDALSGLSTPYGSQEREAQYGVLGYFRTVSRRRCH